MPITSDGREYIVRYIGRKVEVPNSYTPLESNIISTFVDESAKRNKRGQIFTKSQGYSTYKWESAQGYTLVEASDERLVITNNEQLDRLGTVILDTNDQEALLQILAERFEYALVPTDT